MKTVIAGGFVIMSLVLCSLAAQAADNPDVVRKTLPNGAQVQYDGTSYDFRSASGVEMIKLWVPPRQTVRGILISGHGGGSGDSRLFARYDSLKGFAARIGFGLAGLHNFPGRRVYEVGGPLFFAALDAFASLGKHPELAHVPFAMYGSSNGGASTYGFVNTAPRRALCFLSNVSASFTPAVPVEDALQVPGVVVIGMYDLLTRTDTGVNNATAAVKAARARGARWSLVVEQKGHEDGISFDLYMNLVERALAARYPAALDPGKGPVQLLNLDEKAGWLADLGTFDNGIATIAPFSEFQGDRAAAGWLIDKDFAFTYRASATHDSPVAIKIADVERIANPHVDPATMFSIGGPVVDPGKRMKVSADLADLPGWKSVEFYDGARKLGEARAPGKPTVSFTVNKDKPVQTLTALVHDRSGKVFPALPFHYFVRDPKVQTRSDAELRPVVYQAPAVAPGSGSAPGNGADLAKPADSALVAFGLTPRQEKLFAAAPGQVSDFWAEIDGDVVVLDRKNSGSEESKFSIVNAADIEVTVKAAHSRQGLYLYYRITDDRFVEADENEYNGTDAVELLIDSKSAKQINDPAMVGKYLNKDWGLTLTTRQYQVATGGKSAPTVLRRNLPDPWDVAYKTETLKDAQSRHGIRILHSKQGRMHRVQEWFLPWSELLGGESAGEPAVGTALGFALSYNDRDGAEMKRLRWIDKKGPWRNAGDKGVAPRGWGDLVIGPTSGDRPTSAASAAP